VAGAINKLAGDGVLQPVDPIAELKTRLDAVIYPAFGVDMPDSLIRKAITFADAEAGRIDQIALGIAEGVSYMGGPVTLTAKEYGMFHGIHKIEPEDCIKRWLALYE
jgi:hypothetical protein